MEKSIKNAIETAIKQCAKDIYKEKVKILCEADFERFLANRIEQILSKKKIIKSDWRVHTHLTHYPEYEPNPHNSRLDAYPDICIIDNSQLNDNTLQHKGYIYKGESVVLELKYLHKNDSLDLIDKDFKKGLKLLISDIAVFYVVVLFDKKCDEKDADLRKRYDDTLNELRNTENIAENIEDRLHCFALYKSQPKCNKIG